MFILFLIVLIGMAGFSIVFPLIPFFGDRVGAGDQAVGWIIAGYSIGQVMGGPLWGRLSDSWGRRPVLIWSTAGAIFSYVLMGYADTAWLLFLSRVLGGLMAGNISTAYAYATDKSDEAERAKVLGRLAAAFGAGFFLGPVLGGLLLIGDSGEVKFLLVSLVAAAITALSFVSAWIWLPESLPAHRRKPFNLDIKLPSLESWRVVLDRKMLMAFILLTFLVNQSSAVASAILPEWQYVTLGMSPQAISFSFAYIAAVTIVAQAWGVGPLVKRYGEERVTQVGVVIYTMALVSLSSSGSLISFFFAMTLLAFGLGIFTPVLNSLISKLAEDHERGAVMGIQQSAAAFSRVTGPLFAWYVYAQFKGSSAFIAATISVVPALIMAFWVAGRSAAARQKVKT